MAGFFVSQTVSFSEKSLTFSFLITVKKCRTKLLFCSLVLQKNIVGNLMLSDVLLSFNALLV